MISFEIRPSVNLIIVGEGPLTSIVIFFVLAQMS